MNNITVTLHREDQRGNVADTTFPNRVVFGGKSFLIPRHFRSDGASVPRLFWRVVFPPTAPEAAAAGICHDFIYRTQPDDWTRSEADRMLLALLIEFGTPIRSALMAYCAVRAFGWIAWLDNGVRLMTEAAEK